MPPGSAYDAVWCKECQIHLATDHMDALCPVCRDEQRRQNEAMYKNRYS